MAIDNLENLAIEDVAAIKKLSYGITQTVINVKNNELSERLSRPKGVYVTYDCDYLRFNKSSAYLSKLLSSCILQLLGILPKDAVILTVGLGNTAVGADSLGTEVVKKVITTRGSYAEKGQYKYSTCTLTAGVAGVTGVKSEEVIIALCEKIKPNAVILVDTLATATPTRVGASFQLTTAGIAPGSGVGGDKKRIDSSVLGVQTIAIGVPLVLSMRTVISNFARSYAEALGCGNDEYKLTSQLLNGGLSNLVVSPKEIDCVVKRSAKIISEGINRAFE